MSIAYRGFVITHPNNNTHNIYKDGALVAWKGSLAQAKAWIDEYWR